MSDSPGISGATARPPTLRKILSASSTRPSTLIVWASSKRAWPRMNVHPSIPVNHDSRPERSSSMTLSLRAFTFAMLTVISPVPTPNSAPRRARCAACALATSVLVGIQPVLTHVPPTSLRSITATVCPAAVSLPASGGPACPAPTMIASNFSAMNGDSDEADEERGQKSAADGHDVLEDRAGAVLSAAGRGKALARRGAGHCAEHGADDSRAGRSEGVEERAADDRAGECARDEPAEELWCRLATRGLRQLVGDQLDQQEDGQHRDGDGVRDPLRPLAVHVDPAQECAPGHHSRRGERAQAGDHTDQQCEHDNEDLRHGNLRT